MVGSRYPFRDPNRRSDDPPPGNRLERPRDQEGGNRRGRQERPRDEGGDNTPPAPPREPAIDLATLTGQVESLIRLVTSTDVTELQIESGNLKIAIRRGNTEAPTPAAASPSVVMMTQPAAAPISLPAPEAAPPAAPAPPPLPAVPGHSPPTTPAAGPGETLVVSPMVGTFYAGASPQDPPYVLEGDEVASGQVIGIVEAMKMMNQIESEVAGRVRRILVRDAQGVEYGQPLMIIAES